MTQKVATVYTSVAIALILAALLKIVNGDVTFPNYLLRLPESCTDGL